MRLMRRYSQKYLTIRNIGQSLGNNTGNKHVPYQTTSVLNAGKGDMETGVTDQWWSYEVAVARTDVLVP